MDPIEQAEEKYGFIANDFYFGKNDPLYKQFIVELAYLDMSGLKTGTHIMLENRRRHMQLFPSIPPGREEEYLNSAQPNYNKEKGYDNTLADVVKLYETILSLYDMAYKMKQYQNPDVGANGGLENRMGKN